jgi:serine/threonine protein kinase
VAIKENLNNDEEAQRQFRREAVLLAHLRHPNLPQVIDYFLESNGRQYLVMEYVPGENLHEVMRRQGALPVNEALGCIDQVMQAVAYMHNQRGPESGHRRAIVHRDIKPANIKRTPEGRYVLVDFGIAKQSSATQSATAVSARALTPGFAPIEQYGAGTDERTDIYSLGATLYALLTGKTPPNSIDLAAGAALPPLRSYNSKIPAEMTKAVERAMKVNAGDRFPRVDDLYTALTGRPIPTTPITGPPPPRPSPKAGADRRLAWLFGALALLSVAGIWWLFASSAPQTDAGTQVAFVATVTPAPPTPTAPEATATFAATATVANATHPSTPFPTSTPMATPTPHPSNTPMPTADAAAAAVANARHTSTPMATSTLMATATPRPSNTPTATSARSPTPAVNRTQPETSGGGPTSARILQPGDNHSSDTSTVFKWVANAPLAPGQEFEVVFWKANGQTEAQGRGIIRSSTASETSQPVADLAPDGYKWALLLVQTEPSYSRLRRLAGPFNFNVPGQWDPYREPDSGSGSASDKRREQP